MLQQGYHHAAPAAPPDSAVQWHVESIQVFAPDADVMSLSLLSAFRSDHLRVGTLVECVVFLAEVAASRLQWPAPFICKSTPMCFVSPDAVNGQAFPIADCAPCVCVRPSHFLLRLARSVSCLHVRAEARSRIE